MRKICGILFVLCIVGVTLTSIDVAGGPFRRSCPPGGCKPGGGGGGGKPPRLDIPIEQLILDVPGARFDVPTEPGSLTPLPGAPRPVAPVAPVPDAVPRQSLEIDVPFAKINPEKYPSMVKQTEPDSDWTPSVCKCDCQSCNNVASRLYRIERDLKAMSRGGYRIEELEESSANRVYPGDLLAPFPDSARKDLELYEASAKISPDPSMALPPGAVWLELDEVSTRQADIAALTAEVIRQLPPVTIQIELPDGRVITKSRPLGEVFRLRLVAH